MKSFKERKNGVKDKIIEIFYPDLKTKSGDVYRGIGIRLEKFLSNFERNAELSRHLPLDIMSDEEIARIVGQYFNRTNENKNNHLILNNLNYKGYRYNYFNLVSHTQRYEEAKDSLRKEEYPSGFGVLSIQEMAKPIYKRWETDESASDKIDYTLFQLKDIVKVILMEHEFYLEKREDITYPIYNEDFMSIIVTVAKSIIYKMIILNDNVKDKKGKLEFIYESLAESENYVKECVVRLQESYKKRRLDERGSEEDCGADVISMCFALYMQRKSLCDERMKILSALKNNPPNIELMKLEKLNSKKIKDYSSQKLRKMFHAENVNRFAEKLDMVRKFIRCIESNEDKIDDIQIIQVVFTAIYHGEKSWQKNQMSTLVKKRILGEEISIPHRLFIEMKLNQMRFLQWGVDKEFYVFMEIIDRLRRILFMTYDAWDYVDALKLLYKVEEQFLNVFKININKFK